MVEDTRERAPPLVEVVVKDLTDDRGGTAGRLARAGRLGAVGALVLAFAGTFALIGFLPWYNAPTPEEVPNVCVDVVPAHVEGALTDLGMAQLGVAAGGFVIFALVGLFLGRKARA